MRGDYKSFKGINLTVLERMHQFIIGGRVGTGRAGQLNLCVDTTRVSMRINVMILERMHQFIMYIL